MPFTPHSRPVPPSSCTQVGSEREWPSLAHSFPPRVGFRIYSVLVEATYETSQPVSVSPDEGKMLSVMACTRKVLGIDDARHELAKLSVCFDLYQRCGSPSLLPRVKDLLLAVLEAAHPSR